MYTYVTFMVDDESGNTIHVEGKLYKSHNLNASIQRRIKQLLKKVGAHTVYSKAG